MAFGRQIRRYRTGLGMTLEQLSDRSGVEVGTISAAENRDSTRMEVTAAVSIANALGLTVEQLDDPGTDYLPSLKNSGGIQNAVVLPSRRISNEGIPVFTWTEIGDNKHMSLAAMESHDPRRHLPWFGDGRISSRAFAVRVDFDSFKGVPLGADVIFNPEGKWSHGAIAIIRRDGIALLRRMNDTGGARTFIAHDAAPWQTEPYNPMTDEIIGVKIGVILIDD